MFPKQRSLIVVLASALLLAVGIISRFANTAQALPPTQTSVTLPYAGRLNDNVGQPVADGAYDFAFALYDAETGGTVQWSETQRSVPVEAGTFAISLGSVTPIPATALKGDEQWLAVGVRGPGESDWTALIPRQLLTPASSVVPASPSAGPACAHDHLEEVWNSNIGWSNAGLRINNSASGPAFWGYNTGGGNGLRGESSTGLGVYGWSDSSSGVVGRSAAKNGVEGYSSAPDVWAGVYGEAPHYGVFGRATSSSWYGVFSDGDMFTTGDLGVAGNLTVGGSKSGYVVDLAQNDDMVALQLGDVVVISGAGPALVGQNPTIKVRLAAAEGTSAVIGVVDKHFIPAAVRDAGSGPSVSRPSYSDAVIAPGEYLTVVTMGSFRAIKADASYGAIAPGDLLVASPNPGYAMRAAAPSPGATIGKALAALPSDTGVIPVMVTLQ